MEVIFLDVDGVLNGGKVDGYSRKLLGDVFFQRLKRLVDSTEAKVVLSSAWRIGYDPENHVPSRTLRDKLRDIGVELYGMTPQIKWFEGKQRGDEIRAWLEVHPEVDSFVILDDDCDMKEFTETNLVKTDREIGLQDADVDKAIQILMKEKKENAFMSKTNIEIEHKYLVDPVKFKEMYPRLKPRKLSVQGYIQINEPNISQVRVACVQRDENTVPGKDVGILNIKGLRQGAARPEYECKIPFDEALGMLNMCSKIIRKYRYCFWYERKWVVDEYLEENAGLWIAETEIPSEDFVFAIPEFVIKDVTDDERYYNKNLVNYPYSQWNRPWETI